MEYNILDESALSSDFTFGFELEALAPGELIDVDWDLLPDAEVRNEFILNHINSLMPEPTGGRAEVSIDTSVYSDNDTSHSDDYDDYEEDGESGGKSYWTNKDYPFEYSSAYYQVTPNNLGRVIYALNELLKEGYYTNYTCGFHQHIRFKGMTERDIIWMYCNICADVAFNKKYVAFITGGISEEEWLKMPYEQSKKYNSYLFRDDQYASTNPLYELADGLLEKDYNKVLKNISDDKKRIFRIHPQGTLEWRGPRNFLNDKDINIIKEFYKSFYQLIHNIQHYMDADYITGTHITKEDLFNGLDKAKKEQNITRDELLKNAEYIGTKQIGSESKFTKDKRNGLSDYGYSQIQQAIESNHHVIPIILNKLKMKDEARNGYYLLDKVIYALYTANDWTEKEKKIIFEWIKDNYSIHYTDTFMLDKLTDFKLVDLIKYLGDEFIRKGLAFSDNLGKIVKMISKLETLKIKHFTLKELTAWVQTGVNADISAGIYKHNCLMHYCIGDFNKLYGVNVDTKLMCMVASLMDNRNLVQDWNEVAQKSIMIRISSSGNRNIQVWNNLMTELSKRNNGWEKFIFSDKEFDKYIK